MADEVMKKLDKLKAEVMMSREELLKLSLDELKIVVARMEDARKNDYAELKEWKATVVAEREALDREEEQMTSKLDLKACGRVVACEEQRMQALSFYSHLCS